MSFATALTFLLLQIGPNPNAGAIPGIPDELLNRPERRTNEIAPPEPTNPTSIWLSDCLDLVDSDPARAHTMAQIRRNATLGAERVIANHCLGLAATNLELWTDAQTAFTAARDETPAEEQRARARFGAMAGNAALVSGNTENAVALLLTAENDAQGAQAGSLESIAATDRARALVTLERPQEAVSALERAAQLTPDRGEIWLYKATLHRRLSQLTDAQTAIERAAELAPEDLQVGLEAGVIAVLSGRDDAARASWQSVVDLAPTSAEAETARAYLDQIGPAIPAE
ncbi:MAG: tetratricopeptide repeat protein [Erythrobacter sp.]